MKLLQRLGRHENNILKNRLLNHVKGKSFNTYELKHDENTSNLYDIIKQHSKEAEQYFEEEKEKELDFHFFYNETILNHRDCLYESLRSLHILQHEEVKGLFVFTDFDIYIDIKEGDLLLFDASQYHYMRRNTKPTEELYRFAINLY